MFRVLIGLCFVGLSLAGTVGETVVPMPDGRIVGGHDTDAQHHPHQVSMRFNKNHRCGGAIVAPNMIFSAAHCVNTLKSTANLTIFAGTTQTIWPSGQELKVREIIMHEKYKSLYQDYDAAMLVLDGEFVYNDEVQPIALAKEVPPAGSAVQVTGWGTTSEGGVISNILQEVEVILYSKERCKRAYPIQFTDRMICAGVDEGGKDSCQGDSGGPLTYDNQLLGIVSWGSGCARAKSPGVYASVPKIWTWATELMASRAPVGGTQFL